MLWARLASGSEEKLAKALSNASVSAHVTLHDPSGLESFVVKPNMKSHTKVKGMVSKCEDKLSTSIQ